MKTMKYGIGTCLLNVLAKYGTLLKNKSCNCPEAIIQPLKPTTNTAEIFNKLNSMS